VARDLAIDLGTANTLVYAKGNGIILNQPTVIALNTRTHEVLAVGNEAWQMIGRTPGYIVAVRPLREGAITDFDITERMIRLLLRRAGVTKFTRPRVLICVPSAITSVERRAVKEAARRAGINVPRIRLFVFMISGASAAIGGVILDSGNSVVKNLSTSRQGFLPAYDPDTCVHCGICDIVCPDLCFVWSDDGEGEPAVRLLGIDYNYCKGCLKCIDACPTGSLTELREDEGWADENRVPLFPWLEPERETV